MSAGTLKLTNGSTAVIGTGTTFTADMTAADVVVVTVGGTVYSLAVDSVTSDTALVLSLPFTGPTTTGVAWQAVPRKTMLRVTAELNKQVTESLRVANENAINWQAVLSSHDTVNVLLPDGTTLTGFSWRKINDLLTALDPDDLSATAAQINTDAQQVATDKPIILQAKTDAETAKTASETAQGKAEAAQQKSEAAQGKSETAQAAAELAATNAAHDASQVNPKNLLHVDQHLSDLTNIPEARATLEVFSKAEIADMLPGYLGQIDWQEMRTALEPGTAPRDGQEVDQTGIFADLYAKALAGKLPTCTEAEWQADPLNRGCYVLESSPGKMRLPDDNGVQPGSLKIPVKVGDGGVADLEGTMAGSALPNIKGTVVRLGATSSLMRNDSIVDGAFELLERETVSPPTQGATIASLTSGVPLGFNAKLYDGIYQDGVTEIRPNRQYGCWTVRYAAKATNGGSIDALALATAIAAGDAELLAKIIATNARIDYALISPETNPALGSRTVFENPFGNNTPVICVCEIFHATLQKWTTTPWIYSSPNSYGMISSYSQGEGIVMTCGKAAFVTISLNCGASQEFTTNYTTVSPVRIHVWKITE
ncbi:hypothetical protein HII27_21195 [Kluyvera sp. SCKS090646]|uniref:Tail fiber protein n=1 Tax=Kluyvera sichuanensis TaxID=2725494 RepID=A0ABR6RYK4_9ENTR|nr:hypothetical protein [Kluyvera sichuanensis]MBC1188219.1 hypothetical protein [Kluyvera sichuanensis]